MWKITTLFNGQNYVPHTTTKDFRLEQNRKDRGDMSPPTAPESRHAKLPYTAFKRKAADTLSAVLEESATESHWTMSPRLLAKRDRD